MVVPRLIERKRSGGSLTGDEWRALVAGYTAGSIPDYQVSALLMAVLFQGLDRDELVALTGAMLDSGSRLNRPDSGPPRVDKHSTGGVGDKTSLILAPMVACCDVAVPMMSGRGLGHTGGTLDKLESIPGFATRMPLDSAARQLDRIGVVMFGQSDEIVPADRKLYALRDVTGTVESVPLITASIMSKKLAEQLDALVLDVKVGSGAFLPRIEDARTLARTMVSLGNDSGCATTAILTAMDRPLGTTAGNALEVIESIEALRGEGRGDLMEVTIALGMEMLLLAGVARDDADAKRQLDEAIGSGRALERFRVMVEEQGGDPHVVDDPGILPRAPVVREVSASEDGVVPPLPPRILGEAVVAMGGGRRTATDDVDPAVGFDRLPLAGSRVGSGDTLVVIHARTDSDADFAVDAFRRAWREGAAGDPLLPLVVERISSTHTETDGEPR